VVALLLALLASIVVLEEDDESAGCPFTPELLERRPVEGPSDSREPCKLTSAGAAAVSDANETCAGCFRL
jgi:hypothetical protein